MASYFITSVFCVHMLTICQSLLLPINKALIGRPPLDVTNNEVEVLFSDSKPINFDEVGVQRTRPYKINNDCVCGTLNGNSTMVAEIMSQDRKELYPELYPWLVAIKYGDGVICTGALVNDLFILTAGHCVHDKSDVSQYEIIFNPGRKSKGNMNATFNRKIDAIKLHGSFNAKNLDYDLALLKLDRPVELTGNLIPICLPSQKNHLSFVAEDGISAGWGSKSFPSFSESLVEILSMRKCRRQRHYSSEFILPTMLCVDYKNGEICPENSGAPLMVLYKLGAVMAGILSMDSSCSSQTATRNGVFTKVELFPNWIYTKTKGGTYCRNPYLNL